MELNLLTLNVHGWQEENQLEKIEALANAIAKKRYDAIALQEVNQPTSAAIIDATQQVRENNYGLVLLSALEKRGITDYTLSWAFSHYSYETYEEGIAFLTRHPIKAKKHFTISRNESAENYKTRVVQKLTLSIEEKDIDLFSCHLGWWNDNEDPAIAQITTLLSEVQPDTTTFLMGDFNNDASILGEGYTYLLESGLTDTRVVANEISGDATVQGKIDGWSDNRKDLRLDYIFAQAQKNVLSHRVIFDNINEPIVSDHFGVECKLQLI